MQNLSLYIVSENINSTHASQEYLMRRFGNKLDIYCLLNKDSDVESKSVANFNIILSPHIKPEQKNRFKETIQRINSLTNVYFFNSIEAAGNAIDSIEYSNLKLTTENETIPATLSDLSVAEKSGSGEIRTKRKRIVRVAALVYPVFNYPVKVLVKELGISKFLAIFLLTFLTVGLAVFINMRFFR